MLAKALLQHFNTAGKKSYFLFLDSKMIAMNGTSSPRIAPSHCLENRYSVWLLNLHGDSD
jgi:hypothetical protein